MQALPGKTDLVSHCAQLGGQRHADRILVTVIARRAGCLAGFIWRPAEACARSCCCAEHQACLRLAVVLATLTYFYTVRCAAYFDRLPDPLAIDNRQVHLRLVCTASLALQP